MSEADIDKILHKYENRPLKYKAESVQYTSRKNEDKGRRMVTFMDESLTPIKNTEPNDCTLLRRLDEAEKSVAHSERKYAEVCRKLDRSIHANHQLEAELEKERKSRLQQLLDFQNKLLLLQNDNKKTVELLKDKDHTIAILKEKMAQKDSELLMCEKQIEEIGKKVSTTLMLRGEQSEAMKAKEMEDLAQSSIERMSEVSEKYEKQLTELRKEISRFDNIFIDKEKEKKGLLVQIEEMAKNHKIQLNEARQALIRNEEEYRKWLDEAREQKLHLSQHYESELNKLRTQKLKESKDSTDNEISTLFKNKEVMKGLERQIGQLQKQIQEKSSEVETLVRADEEQRLKITMLSSELEQSKKLYTQQIKETQKYLQQVEHQEQELDHQKDKANKFEIEFSKLKGKCEEVLSENEKLAVENEGLKAQMKGELRSLKEIRKELNCATDNQINMNATLTENSIKLKNKIKFLEQELESTTNDLYAQRLENAKLREEIKETKEDLKREYELSIQSTRKELEEQIKQRNESTLGDPERELTYLQFRELEYKYEAMTSQIVTVEELLKSATKIHKYYQK